jgi:hypothetical protein
MIMGYLQFSLKYRMKSALELMRPKSSCGMWRRFFVPTNWGCYGC